MLNRSLQKAVVAERLESRRLLSGFAASIDFAPAGAVIPSGSTADTGAVFGDRGNGLVYGWNGPRPAQVAAPHIRSKLAGPDERYDTFAVMHARGRGSRWQIEVPNGTYLVSITAGDPRSTSGRYRVMADGVLVVDGKASRAQRWVSGSQQLSTSNGLLTLTVPAGTTAKLDFVDIQQIVAPAAPPPTPTPDPTPSPNPNPTPNPNPNPTPTPSNGLEQPLTWQTLGRAPIALAEAQSVVANGKLYVFGGYNVTSPDYQPTNASEVYDATTNAWSTLAPMPAAETHMGVATDGRFIYVAGGYTFDPRTTYQTFSTANAFRYDIQSNAWSTFVPLPAARGAGAMIYLDGQLHFVGGVNTSRAGQTEHWVLNLNAATPTWTDSTTLPLSVNHTSTVVLNGKIYVVGGQTTSDDSSTVSTLMMWDPGNPSAWTMLASMPVRRSHAVVTVIDGRIVVAGGTTGSDVPLNSVIVYNPDTNTWAFQTSLPDARLASVGGVIGNQIIVATGFGSGALQAQTWVAAVS